MTDDLNRAFRQHRPAMLRFAGRLVPSDIDPEDVVQGALIEAWRLQITTKAGLLHLTRFAASRSRRPKTRFGITMSPVTSTQLSDEYSTDRDTRCAENASPPWSVYLSEVRREADKLGPAKQAALLALSNGETAAEFAAREGKSLASVTMAISDGRKQLKRLLRDDRPFTFA